ncbi:MAG TPA: type II toxin-antitoxin system HicA family toxin [Candidatus Paceibacterota bacterium]|nr:type II toxin-antitoxin system HicA family toxin [Candidatus Paceibacterota bacterium]
MTKGVFNWNYYDVVAVLKQHKFYLNHTRGSHHYYVGSVGGKLHQVQVPFHGSKTFKPRTLNAMVRQSGLTRSDWGL